MTTANTKATLINCLAVIEGLNKIILIPDSFKGTMTSIEVCGIMEREIKRVYPEAQVVSIPVEDGGEGTADCFLAAMGGKKEHVRVQGVFGEPTDGFYALLDDHKTAVVELACCAGLPLAEGRLNPLTATTYGVGQLLLAALDGNIEHIILGLGGSATNDGGCGLAVACGVRFEDSSGKAFVPTGGTLGRIARISLAGRDSRLNGVKITAVCDIDNPLFGENGAAHVFAPQKGADPAAVRELDAGLVHLSDIIKRDLGRDISAIPGAGAAGGAGAGVCAFLGSDIQMGIETALDITDFDRHLTGTDLVFTGEGRLDGQSLRGKVVIGVARRASARGVPVAAVVGDIAGDCEEAYSQGVTAIFSTNMLAVDFRIARLHARDNLAVAMKNIMRFAHIFCEVK